MEMNGIVILHHMAKEVLLGPVRKHLARQKSSTALTHRPKIGECAKMFHIGNGYLLFQSGFVFISGSTEAFLESSVARLTIRFVKLTLWRSAERNDKMRRDNEDYRANLPRARTAG